jgi:tRNA(Ile)-lysidine synthase
MIVNIPRGKYVLAVSGGVDSMTLLDLLAQKAGVNVIVAHFNHGVRADAAEDEQLVARAAQEYNLPLEVGYGKLGTLASEEDARDTRYGFLESVSKKTQAMGIITAHHQDDLIETAFLNILRGTGRTGLSSIRHSKVYRPLLQIPKKEILAYAKKNKVQWREDTTNRDPKYLRNYIRRHITPGLTGKKKVEIIDNLDKVAKINKIIDDEIATLSHLHQANCLDRQAYTMLPAQVGEELLISWLRQNRLRDFDKKTIKRLSIVIRTGQPGSKHDIMNGRKLKLTARSADLV